MRQIGRDMVEHLKTVQNLVRAYFHMKQAEDRWQKGKAPKLEENMREKELGNQQHKADTPGLSNTEKIGIMRNLAWKITQRPEGFRFPDGVGW